MATSKKVSYCTFCLIFMNWCILVKNEMPACPYLPTSRYKNTNHTLHISVEILLTLFRMGFFGAAHGWEEGKKDPLTKICHTYPTMMKLGTVVPYPKKIQKIYESRETFLEFCWHQYFFAGNQQILPYQEVQI